jgi:hypothetical protein
MLGTRKPIITFENWHQTSSVLFNYFVDQDLKILASAKDMIVNDLEKGENMNKFEFSYQSMVSMISTHQFNHHNFFTTLLHHAVRYRAHSFEDLNNWIDGAPIVLGKKPAWAYEAVDSFLIYDISYGLSPQSSATTLSSILTDARVCTSATRGSGNENIRPYCARRLSRRS